MTRNAFLIILIFMFGCFSVIPIQTITNQSSNNNVCNPNSGDPLVCKNFLFYDSTNRTYLEFNVLNSLENNGPWYYLVSVNLSQSFYIPSEFEIQPNHIEYVKLLNTLFKIDESTGIITSITESYSINITNTNTSNYKFTNEYCKINASQLNINNYITNPGLLLYYMNNLSTNSSTIKFIPYFNVFSETYSISLKQTNSTSKSIIEKSTSEFLPNNLNSIINYTDTNNGVIPSQFNVQIGNQTNNYNIQATYNKTQNTDLISKSAVSFELLFSIISIIFYSTFRVRNYTGNIRNKPESE